MRRFFRNNQSETKIACGGHFCLRIGTKCANFIENVPIHKQALPQQAILVSDWSI
jgi:hypothetical protein